jgi:hypothetical protein
MESGLPRDVTIPGWEGFPTKQYTYSIKDNDSTMKTADVVLLDPTADQIAQWIVSALLEVRGKYDPEEGRKIFKHVISQSGGQFPVAGVVYEDILPADGVNEIYCFRDGVTVEIDGVKHRGAAPMTPDQIQSSLTGKITRVFQYARIQSTSPKMWIDSTGEKSVLDDNGKPTPQWCQIIRREYQKAWTSDRNALMVAWVKANPK